MADYQPGQQAFYHEDGNVWRVEVLENNSDSEWERYVLMVKENVRLSGFIKPSEIGETFRCDKRRDVAVAGLWHLLEND